VSAWTMPRPSMNSFGSLTNTWYCEHKNPTARKVVYNE
jgi:hypothetical protein